MPPCVQVWNQIFHGEFQLSDKVGCILAYPGSYPHSTWAHPTIPGYILLVFRIILLQTQYLTKLLACNTKGHIRLSSSTSREAPSTLWAIPLPLREVNPSVAAWLFARCLSAFPSLATAQTKSPKRADERISLWCHVTSAILYLYATYRDLKIQLHLYDTEISRHNCHQLDNL